MKWATWLYYPDGGKRVCLKHLHGRTWQGTEREAEKIAMWKQQHDKKVLGLVEENSSEMMEHKGEPKPACNGNVNA
jgi:hypothetical protein